MLAASARRVPDMASASSESSSALNNSLSPSLSILTSLRSRCDRVPSGPLMESASTARIASLPRVVLEADLELRLAFLFADGEAFDVTLVLEHLGDRNLDFGRRNADRGLADRLGVADAGQHIGDGIGHAHARNLLLPARLDQSRDLTAQRDLAELVASQSELAKDPARPAGQPAAIAQAHGRRVPRQLLELLARLLAVLVGAPGIVDEGEDRGAPGGELRHRLAALCFAIDENELGHGSPSGLEWKAEGREQRARFVVGLRRGGDADVEPPQGVDLVVLDLREDDLLLDAEVVVAAAVERAVRDAAEVADARNRDGDQAVEEFIHARAAQGHHAADRKILPDLENRDRLLRFRDHGLLAGDLAEVRDGVVQDLLVR